MTEEIQRKLKVGDKVILLGLELPHGFRLERHCGPVAREHDNDFSKNLKLVGLKEGDEGEIMKIYMDNWVEVKFDGCKEPLHIPKPNIRPLK